MPASEKEVKYAALLYFKTFEKELPQLEYRKQDIAYIIEQLETQSKEEVFMSTIIH